MKKIILALMLTISASFAFTFPTYYSSNGQNYKLNQFNTSYSNRICTYDVLSTGSILYYVNTSGGVVSSIHAVENEVDSTICAQNKRSGNGYSQSTTVYYPDNSCLAPKLIVNGECGCPADQDLVAGECVPKCPTGQNVGADGRCAGVCTTGSHWDYNATIPSCVGDVKYGDKIAHENGAYHVLFADGSLMFCRTDGKCLTTALDGTVIPNHYYAGGIPDAPNVYSDLLNDALTITGDLVGKTLQIAGYTIGVSSSGFGILLSEDNPATGAINPGVVAGATLVSLGNLLVTNNEKIITTPTDSGNAVKVYFNDSSTNNASISDSAPSDGSKATVPNSNGVQAQKLYSEQTLKEYQSHWAGQGELGATVLSAADQVQLSIMETNKQIKAIQKTSDTTATVTEINKSDIANTVANGTDLPYTQKQVTQTLNNDGTVKTTETITPSTVSPKTNNNTSTNPTTGDTTTAKPSTGTNTANNSNGTSLDLSGVTGRLDGLANQLTTLNGKGDNANGLLGDIKGNTGAAVNGLVNVQNQLGNANSALNSIKDLMSQSSDGLTEQTWDKSIPSDYSVFDTWKTAWTNMKGDIDSVSSKGTELKELVSGNLELNLIDPVMLQCPYNANLDLVFAQIPISFDFCSVLSPFRPIIYNMFYLYFVFNIIASSLKILVRLV